MNSRRPGRLVLGPDLNRSESKGALPGPPPVLPPQTIAHTIPLHCGISGLSMTAVGHSGQTHMVATLSACPLRSDRVRHSAPHRSEATCQQPTLARSSFNHLVSAREERGRHGQNALALLRFTTNANFYGLLNGYVGLLFHA
jgi:hypothetical protein